MFLFFPVSDARTVISTTVVFIRYYFFSIKTRVTKPFEYFTVIFSYMYYVITPLNGIYIIIYVHRALPFTFTLTRTHAHAHTRSHNNTRSERAWFRHTSCFCAAGRTLPHYSHCTPLITYNYYFVVTTDILSIASDFPVRFSSSGRCTRRVAVFSS